MRVPIAYALHYPERVDVPVARLDLLAAASLDVRGCPTSTRSPPARSPAQAASAGGTAPCVLNAANEVAVHAFLDGAIAFMRIAEVIEATLDELGSQPLREFEQLFDARPSAAREAAARRIAAL